MGTHRGPLKMVPPRGIKKSGGQKRPPTYGVFEIKKISWGGSVIINQKEIKLGPHRGPLKMVPPRGTSGPCGLEPRGWTSDGDILEEPKKNHKRLEYCMQEY